jgi:poly(3-hydroxybutyrate) depolymerase
MFYPTFQARQDMLAPLRVASRGLAGLLGTLEGRHPVFDPLHAIRAAADVVGHAGVTQKRPPFGIGPVRVGNQLLEVEEEVVARTPFASLVHFRKDIAQALPRVLVVAPMSGHFATLLAGTVKVLLQDHDVFITDWHNARDVPVGAGRFGMDEYVEHIMAFQRAVGPGGHVLAVCQPVVAVIAAVALMAVDRDPASPRSMTLLAGPVDARQHPTKVNQLASSRGIEWFERTLIATVPWRYQGSGRKVYPGALQLAAFMSMNIGRHVKAHQDQFWAVFDGDAARAAQHRKFYDEYLAVMDLPAEFFLETVKAVFQDHALARGTLAWRGRAVRPEAIRRTAVLAVEGEKDDICGIGQTMAALDLCRSVPVTMRRYHLQTGVGHYGVFSGKRFAQAIYPRIREMIQAHQG